MDWRIYEAVYGVSLHHHWVGSLFSGIEAASIPLMVVLTVGLWLLARPGGHRKWKLAATAALGSAALALAFPSTRFARACRCAAAPTSGHHPDPAS